MSEQGPAGTPATTRAGRSGRTPKTAEVIAGDLRRQIVRGDLAPGDTLPPEAHLLERYGVSRPTLREAFRILETEALVSVRRGARGGAQVMRPDISVATRHIGLLLQMQGTTVEDIFEARILSEAYCAGLLAVRRTAQDLAELREAVAELRGLVDGQGERSTDPEPWTRAAVRIHQLVLERSRSKTLAVQGSVLLDIVAAHLGPTTEDEVRSWWASGGLASAADSCDRLVELVAARDAERAESHWRAHMEATADLLLSEGRRTTRVVELFD